MEQTTKRNDLRLTALTKYYLGVQIKNKISRACGMYRREERDIQRFGGKNRREETTWMTEA